MSSARSLLREVAVQHLEGFVVVVILVVPDREIQRGQSHRWTLSTSEVVASSIEQRARLRGTKLLVEETPIPVRTVTLCQGGDLGCVSFAGSSAGLAGTPACSAVMNGDSMMA